MHASDGNSFDLFSLVYRAPKRDWHAALKRSNGAPRDSRQPGRSAPRAGWRACKRRHGPCAGGEGGRASPAGGSGPLLRRRLRQVL